MCFQKGKGVRMKKFLIFHLKRSGGHAIINWLNKLSESYLHFNDCKIENGNILTDKCNHNGEIFTFRKSDIHILEFKTLIYSFEDKFIQKIDDREDFKYITILRDPYNCLASRHKNAININRGNKAKFPNDVYLQYASSEDAYLINYNKWFLDQKYRIKIANDLGFTDYDGRCFDDVYWFGVSSFDGYNFDGKASKMDVLSRWEEFKDNSELWKLITYPVKEFAYNYFGMDPFGSCKIE